MPSLWVTKSFRMYVHVVLFPPPLLVLGRLAPLGFCGQLEPAGLSLGGSPSSEIQGLECEDLLVPLSSLSLSASLPLHLELARDAGVWTLSVCRLPKI